MLLVISYSLSELSSSACVRTKTEIWLPGYFWLIVRNVKNMLYPRQMWSSLHKQTNTTMCQRVLGDIVSINITINFTFYLHHDKTNSYVWKLWHYLFPRERNLHLCGFSVIKGDTQTCLLCLFLSLWPANQLGKQYLCHKHKRQTEKGRGDQYFNNS